VLSAGRFFAFDVPNPDGCSLSFFVSGEVASLNFIFAVNCPTWQPILQPIVCDKLLTFKLLW